LTQIALWTAPILSGLDLFFAQFAERTFVHLQRLHLQRSFSHSQFLSLVFSFSRVKICLLSRIQIKFSRV
jgi:hypothetical protein